MAENEMPRSYDPTRSALLQKAENSKRAVSMEDMQSTSNKKDFLSPTVWTIPQFSIQPPEGSRVSSRLPSENEVDLRHRGELDMMEKYTYDLSRAQLKASSRTSALLSGFAMIALVELQYDEDTPHFLLIILGVVTSLLVSVHLLALMMSTCILPYMEATGCTQDSPHKRLKFYIDLSWLFSTCIGLLLFLVEIEIIFLVKFNAVGFMTAGYISTIILLPVFVVFVVFSYLIHKSRVSYSLGRFKHKTVTMRNRLRRASLPARPLPPALNNSVEELRLIVAQNTNRTRTVTY